MPAEANLWKARKDHLADHSKRDSRRSSEIKYQITLISDIVGMSSLLSPNSRGSLLGGAVLRGSCPGCMSSWATLKIMNGFQKWKQDRK
jgi:hypothetical protein